MFGGRDPPTRGNTGGAVVEYSRLAFCDQNRTLRALRNHLIDPIIAVHNGRVVKCSHTRSFSYSTSGSKFTEPYSLREQKRLVTSSGGTRPGPRTSVLT
jgi:hypothetical protein